MVVYHLIVPASTGGECPPAQSPFFCTTLLSLLLSLYTIYQITQDYISHAINVLYNDDYSNLTAVAQTFERRYFKEKLQKAYNYLAIKL